VNKFPDVAPVDVSVSLFAPNAIVPSVEFEIVSLFAKERSPPVPELVIFNTAPEHVFPTPQF